MTLQHPPTSLAKQSGAALLVSLVMLLLLTIIGVSSIGDMTMQTNMTRNSQFKMQIFNTALSEGEAQYEDIPSDISVLSRAWDNGNEALPVKVPVDADKIEVTANLEFLSAGGAVIAQSKSGAMSMGQMQRTEYEINSLARIKHSGSESDQYQGIRYTAPEG